MSVHRQSGYQDGFHGKAQCPPIPHGDDSPDQSPQFDYISGYLQGALDRKRESRQAGERAQ